MRIRHGVDVDPLAFVGLTEGLLILAGINDILFSDDDIGLLAVLLLDIG